jgi:hypothetical protein
MKLYRSFLRCCDVIEEKSVSTVVFFICSFTSNFIEDQSKRKNFFLNRQFIVIMKWYNN